MASYTYIQIYTHIYAYRCIHIHRPSHTYAHTVKGYKHRLTDIHTNILTNTDMYTNKHTTHTHKYKYIYTFTPKHVYTYTNTHTHKNTCKNIHIVLRGL